MSKSRIIELLEKVSKSSENKDGSIQGFQEVITEIKGIAEYVEAFDETLYSLGSTAPFHHLSNLARFLLARSRVVGAQRSIEEVDEYIAKDTYRAWVVVTATGPYCDQGFEFSDSVKICNRDSSPIDSISKLFEINTNTVGDQISIALITPVDHPKCIDKNETGVNKVVSEASAKLLDIANAISISRVGGCPIQCIAKGVIPDENVPGMGAKTWSLLTAIRPVRLGRDLTELDIDSARKIYKLFESLSEQDKQKLRIPISKYCQTVSSLDPIESAANLRTALDSTFLDDKQTIELVYRLSLRAALFLEVEDLEIRKRIKTLITNVYRWCSSAVHEGKLPKKAKDPQIKEAIECVRVAVLKRIEKPRFDWEEFELGGSGTG